MAHIHAVIMSVLMLIVGAKPIYDSIGGLF
jgi:hypothetical protein